MGKLRLIEAAKQADTEALKALLSAGADLDEQDKLGWTAVSWAAGRGETKIVKLLVEKGADLTLSGPDRRTPLMIAGAAGHERVVEVLTKSETEDGLWQDPAEGQHCCLACYLRDLRRFEEWTENRPHTKESAPYEEKNKAGGNRRLSDDDIVYLHWDHTVTKAMWHNEDVIFDQITPQWKAFCEDLAP